MCNCTSVTFFLIASLFSALGIGKCVCVCVWTHCHSRGATNVYSYKYAWRKCVLRAYGIHLHTNPHSHALYGIINGHKLSHSEPTHKRTYTNYTTLSASLIEKIDYAAIFTRVYVLVGEGSNHKLNGALFVYTSSVKCFHSFGVQHKCVMNRENVDLTLFMYTFRWSSAPPATPTPAPPLLLPAIITECSATWTPLR